MLEGGREIVHTHAHKQGVEQRDRIFKLTPHWAQNPLWVPNHNLEIVIWAETRVRCLTDWGSQVPPGHLKCKDVYWDIQAEMSSRGLNKQNWGQEIC